MTKVHFYKGYAIDKPEGCKFWNIHEIVTCTVGRQIDYCFSLAYCKNLKEARITIDNIIKEER